ncbi:MAG: hypothetical protein KGN80_08575 [Acidobacteriota bacterium]|nr:hypothetical protein [Acidobacteriota bacterium]
MKTRNVFGIIFLVTGLGIFYVLASNSIATELHDVLHGPPLTEPARKAMPAGLNRAIDKVLPTKVENLLHIKYLNGREAKGQSTDENPFLQFDVVRWLGWAFIWAALMEIGVAYLSHTKIRVEE